MLLNTLKTACRNLLRQRGYALINILGLAIGMAGCLLILTYVRHELSYDDFNVDADRIHRVAGSYRFGGRDFDLAVAPAPQGETMVRDFPEVEAAVRFRQRGSRIVQYGQTGFRERRVSYADAAFFDMFTIPLFQGDPQTALLNPNTLVLSRGTAEKYFRGENPIGKTLRLDNRDEFQVTGVFEEIPDNSHFHFDMILSMASLDEARVPTWMSQNFQTYIRLRPGADPAALEAKFPAMIEKYMGPEIEKFLGKPLRELAADGKIGAWNYLQPLRSIHLHSDLLGELGPNSDIRYVYIFSAIALFILLIAAVNFMNLSTARSAGRAKEVGIRKVLGSDRRRLIGQFLTESLLMSSISMAVAVAAAAGLLPLFNRLAGKELTAGHLAGGGMPGWIVLMAAATGLLAGIYPALFISAFQPLKTLKGRLRTGLRSGILRSGLVVFQFTTSIVLIIGSLVAAGQIRFIQNKKLGFDKRQVLMLENAFLLGDQAEAFKADLLNRPEVESATVSGYLPVPSNRSNNAVIPDGNRSDNRTTSIQNWVVDHDYLRTLGMSLAQGRDFSRDYPTDADTACIINQAAARQFGWDNPLQHRLGRVISQQGDMRLYQVIGVVEDFHYESLRDNIGPMVLFLGESRGQISFRVRTEDSAAMIGLLRARWEDFLPHQPFEYSFLDDRFESMYRSERRISRIFGVFAALAVFIGCLGLFGLAAFTAEQRTREIGIRKVLGASAPGIVRLLMREFVVLVGIANLIAWPTAYFAMRRWLEDFAYRISLQPAVFIGAGAVTLIIAVLTVSWQAVRAALADPADSLRYE